MIPPPIRIGNHSTHSSGHELRTSPTQSQFQASSVEPIHTFYHEPIPSSMNHENTHSFASSSKPGIDGSIHFSAGPSGLSHSSYRGTRAEMKISSSSVPSNPHRFLSITSSFPILESSLRHQQQHHHFSPSLSSPITSPAGPVAVTLAHLGIHSSINLPSPSHILSAISSPPAKTPELQKIMPPFQQIPSVSSTTSSPSSLIESTPVPSMAHSPTLVTSPTEHQHTTLPSHPSSPSTSTRITPYPLPQLKTSPSISSPTIASTTTTTTTTHREKSRKISHSIIEKRRREKINDRLLQLRNMVPSCANKSGTLHKLDILEETVVYIQELHQRLESLERRESFQGQTTAFKRDASPGVSDVETATMGSPSQSINGSDSHPLPVHAVAMTPSIPLSPSATTNTSHHVLAAPLSHDPNQPFVSSHVPIASVPTLQQRIPRPAPAELDTSQESVSHSSPRPPLSASSTVMSIHNLI